MFDQAEGLDYNSLGQRPRDIEEEIGRLKACVIEKHHHNAGFQPA